MKKLQMNNTKQCALCTHQTDAYFNCSACIWYSGPRFYADNIVELKDLYVLSPSKVAARSANKEFAENFIKGFKEGIENERA